MGKDNVSREAHMLGEVGAGEDIVGHHDGDLRRGAEGGEGGFDALLVFVPYRGGKDTAQVTNGAMVAVVVHEGLHLVPEWEGGFEGFGGDVPAVGGAGAHDDHFVCAARGGELEVGFELGLGSPYGDDIPYGDDVIGHGVSPLTRWTGFAGLVTFAVEREHMAGRSRRRTVIYG
jgi:hypothetical protein